MTEPITPSLIPWHRRMEARVAVGVSLLVGLSLGAVLLASTRALMVLSLGRASDNLTSPRGLRSIARSMAAPNPPPH